MKTFDSRERAGFTLMELVIVVVIVGMMLGAVVPLFGGSFRTLRANGAVKELLNALKFAQESAITSGVEHRVYFAPDDNVYWVLRKKASIPTSASELLAPMEFEPVADQLGTKQALPRGIRLAKVDAIEDDERDADYVAFYPDGGGSIAKIEVENEFGPETTIETRGRLGEFKVKESKR